MKVNYVHSTLGYDPKHSSHEQQINWLYTQSQIAYRDSNGQKEVGCQMVWYSNAI